MTISPEAVIPRGDMEALNRAESHLCKTDLRYLCKNVLGYKDWDVCHDDLNEFLKANHDAPRQLILVPREHLKTSIVTVAGAIQAILNDPNVTILISNLVLSNAEKILSEIKDSLMKPDMVAMFGDFVGPLWNRDEIVVKQRTITDKTPTISIGSPDKVLTSQHYDLIILDDILDDSVLGTADQILKTRNYYSKTIDLLKRPHGKLRVVGTRYDDKDLYGTISREMKDEYKIYVRGATYDGTLDGELIFPKKFSNEILKKLLKEKGSFSFWTQYFNQVVNRENQQFNPPVRYWTEEPKDGLNFVTVDLAGEEADADFNVITDMVWSKTNQLYVLEYDCGHYTAGQMVDKIFNLVERRNPRCVYIEAVAYQRVFLYLLSVEMRKRNKFFSVAPIHPHKDKFTRIMALQPWWEQGNILLKPGMIELEEQFDRFPRALHDDIIDTVAYAVPVVQGTIPVIDVKAPYAEIKDDLSRREWEQRAKDRLRKQEADLPLASIGV